MFDFFEAPCWITVDRDILCQPRASRAPHGREAIWKMGKLLIKPLIKHQVWCVSYICPLKRNKPTDPMQGSGHAAWSIHDKRFLKFLKSSGQQEVSNKQNSAQRTWWLDWWLDTAFCKIQEDKDEERQTAPCRRDPRSLVQHGWSMVKSHFCLIHFDL